MGGGFLDKNKYPRSKKITLILIILLVVIGLIIGISYAYWTSKSTQKAINSINSDCLKVEITDVTSGITLDKAYPIRDSEAESLTPYTFTINNVCGTSVYYNVNLEIMNATNRLNSKYIAVKINDGSKNLLSNYASVEPTYKDEDYTAVEARELIEYGMLDGGKSVTYNIKLWMDESVTINDDAMNKSFDSKISVVASQETFNPVLARYITDLALTDKTNLVIDDETADHNTRYIGSDPDNYLCFDSKCTNGKWRVIGVMNNMTTSEGETKSLVKIIRNYSIGTYSWDNDNINDWTTSSSNNYLNGDWYDSNLADYDDLIESVVWGLGGYSKDTIIASDFYSYERNTIVYSDRPTEWTGKVALIYPSDYGYATSGGDIGRETCLTYNLGNWSSYDDCKKFDFVYNSANTWTLMPNLSSKNIFLLDVTGNILYYADSSSSANIKPSLYLKDNAKILSGSGTNIDPWIIGL